MKKYFFIFILLFLFLTLFETSVFAQSEYVLPYPSGMPGSLTYKAHVLYEKVSRYWYFGDFGQFDYNLKLSDKYLVEAKTLFEYKQYLLGYAALKKSDQYFINILPNLVRAEKNGKNVVLKMSILNKASEKHVEILQEIEKNVPENFNWKPEKSMSTELKLRNALTIAMQLRVQK